MALVHQTAKLIRAISAVWKQKIAFTAVALLVFGVSVASLAMLDLLPERKEVPVVTATKTEAVTTVVQSPELPERIEIPSIKLKVNVANPNSTDVATLDAALHTGAVRYPLSAKLGEDGNVIAFGHSSYLPVVNNPAYKAFNEIQKLKVGERIMVVGTDNTFVYVVETVNSANAGTDAIPLTVTGKMLTLATCDSFGTKSDRFVVTASFVESYPNAS